MNQAIAEVSKEYYLNVYYKCGSCGQDRRDLAGWLRGSSQVDKKKAIKIIHDCPVCASALYKTFREETGYCETCWGTLDVHKRCYLCCILLGPGHESEGRQVDQRDPDKLWCGSCRKLTTRAVVPAEED